jgi:KDO2-lipid IV(A) lauroyltransferase
MIENAAGADAESRTRRRPRLRRVPRRPATTAVARHRLEAPHRRRSGAPRPVERTAVAGYRFAEWLIQHLPTSLSRAAIAGAAQASYLLWPKRRRWSNDNFGRVLGVAPSDGAVRSLALSAYGTYARYLVELMRLPRLSVERVSELVMAEGVERIIEIWRESGHGLIVTAGHVGNNEAVAAGLAGHGLPIAAVADDSTFPEIFEHLRRQREAWNITLVPWRNLREVYSVLRRAEILALLIDWGYRDDGVPVRLFGAWTTLPEGPVALAAKTGAPIVHVAARRLPGNRFEAVPGEIVRVASTEPAEILRATQALADGLAATIAAAPEQWYSFKPMWPSTAEESADLEHRAAVMASNRRDPGPARSRRRAAMGPEIAPASETGAL